MEFKRKKITFKNKPTVAYAVVGLDPTVFRGLKIIVIKDKISGWYAYEATTQITVTPTSWNGGFSNATRAGIIQIVANKLRELPEESWEIIQKKIRYQLKGSPNG
ncbi:hypothetical protein F4Z99_04070 [Candidatus Poribacteria bacterium]|nr:hypothetical protein [Candidatus Poribacteria bacterium]